MGLARQVGVLQLCNQSALSSWCGKEAVGQLQVESSMERGCLLGWPHGWHLPRRDPLGTCTTWEPCRQGRGQALSQRALFCCQVYMSRSWPSGSQRHALPRMFVC